MTEKKIRTGYITQISNSKTADVFYVGEGGCSYDIWVNKPWKLKKDRIAWADKFIGTVADHIAPETMTYQVIRVETYKQGNMYHDEYIDE